MERLADKVILVWGFRRMLLAVFAGAFGVLALPPIGFFAAMFVSFTLLVWLIDGSAAAPNSNPIGRLWPSFVIGWLFGFGYFVGGLWWLGHALMIDAEEFAWALPLAIFGLPALLAIFYGLATALARIFWSDGIGRIAALAASFGLLEWARSVVFTGFPWNAIGYAMTPVPLMMQSAHVIGIMGITALAVFVFSAPALLGTRQGAKLGVPLAALIFAAHLGYGAYTLYGPSTPTQKADDKSPVVRLVQPMIEQTAKMDSDGDRAAIFEKHLKLSAEPPKDGGKKPDIIVWPETSIPFILTDNQDALTRIADTLDDNQILLAGAVRVEDMGPGNPPRYYNSIYMIDGRGQIIGAADKVHLVPFGEYMPFESILNEFGIQNIVEMPGGFSSAANRQLLTLPSGLKLYPLVCYEIIFPDEMTGDIGSAAAILNITNDAWFGATPGPYQHFQQARVRAVETGLPLIRDGNSGISALVDAKGRVIAGLALNETGFIDATLDGSAFSSSSTYARQRYFWLIEILLFVIATGSRFGFVFKQN
ncbi:apolipoprotein N-acyltransferase [Rhizobium grahamii]|uniref:Apolipoprotein N-acyltransferase n=1 Tax=Rhizobium grahamii TaxID=1120045 RepID=A0A5Q0CEG2_9HYPH|nr:MULTISPECIES: apolipoprotein N-acyltransferase [Rhizobium]QFY62189.1 apolipoprotein N-acyltransferase [Rhizobium grahamii]QRM48624.1 apolipoprotein N-acyltransferase [Rhizobium sp. BG6]